MVSPLAKDYFWQTTKEFSIGWWGLLYKGSSTSPIESQAVTCLSLLWKQVVDHRQCRVLSNKMCIYMYACKYKRCFICYIYVIYIIIYMSDVVGLDDKHPPIYIYRVSSFLYEEARMGLVCPKTTGLVPGDVLGELWSLCQVEALLASGCHVFSTQQLCPFVGHGHGRSHEKIRLANHIEWFCRSLEDLYNWCWAISCFSWKPLAWSPSQEASLQPLAAPKRLCFASQQSELPRENLGTSFQVGLKMGEYLPLHPQ